MPVPDIDVKQMELSVTDKTGWAEILIPECHTVQSIDADGKLGHVEQRDGKWLYILDGPMDLGAIHGPNTVKDADAFTLTLTDQDGKTVKGHVMVSITDDIPMMGVSCYVLSGSSIFGQLDLAYGADGLGNLAINGNAIASRTEITGIYGTLTVNPDGSWSYLANPMGVGETGGRESFTAQIIDGTAIWQTSRSH